MDHQYKEHPAPTGRLVDGQLVPVPESVSAGATVWLALPTESGEVQLWEGLAAHRLTSGDTVEVRAVPLFAYDVNYGDELSVVVSADGTLVGTGIVKDAGNHTFRLWFPSSADGDGIRSVVEEFGPLGCLIESYSTRLIGLSAGPSEAQVVADALQAGQTNGRFIYETGRQHTR
ncbi:DUF4265 domain-containing protein [Kribbella sp. NBC_00662]|uniref:DUF4265 domain-containing protein n=1 Tax=Kribbella sp. NBC_00662 TaxID=2975969 RepID=UPI003244C662